MALGSHWAKAGVQARLAGVLRTELLRARPSSTGYCTVTASCHPTSVTIRPSRRVCCVSQNRVCESDGPGSRSRAPAVWSVVSRVDATQRADVLFRQEVRAGRISGSRKQCVAFTRILPCFSSGVGPASAPPPPARPRLLGSLRTDSPAGKAPCARSLRIPALLPGSQSCGVLQGPPTPHPSVCLS